MIDSTAVIQSDLDALCDALADDFPALANRTVMMTGGAGFLGYYMVQAILHWNKRGASDGPVKLIVVDNFFRGIPSWLERIEADPNATLLRHDITDGIPTGHDTPHFIIHAAGIASPTVYREYPIETIDANVGGLRVLLDYCVERSEAGNPVSSMLFFSSSEIYGDPPPEEIPTDETYRGNVSCTGPRACYDESKRFGETLCVNFAQARGVPVTVARPFNNYGPGLRINDGRVIPDFARDILAGRDIVMKSDGSPTRTFCYATDAVAGYFKVLLRGRAGEAYNIGTERPEVSILALAERMTSLASDLWGYDGQVVSTAASNAEYLEDNPYRRCPLILKARNELGYEPRVDLDEGLRRSLVWYAGNRSESPA